MEIEIIFILSEALCGNGNSLLSTCVVPASLIAGNKPSILLPVFKIRVVLKHVPTASLYGKPNCHLPPLFQLSEIEFYLREIEVHLSKIEFT